MCAHQRCIQNVPQIQAVSGTAQCLIITVSSPRPVLSYRFASIGLCVKHQQRNTDQPLGAISYDQGSEVIFPIFGFLEDQSSTTDLELQRGRIDSPFRIYNIHGEVVVV